MTIKGGLMEPPLGFHYYNTDINHFALNRLSPEFALQDKGWTILFLRSGSSGQCFFPFFA